MPKTDKSSVATKLRWSLSRETLRVFGVATFAVFSSSLAAAQGAVSLSTITGASGPPIAEHWFGDTATHNVRVLAFDPATELAQVYMRQPKNVIVLAIIPGKDIEVITPGDTKPSSMGQNLFALFMTRFENTNTSTNPNAAQSQEIAIDRRVYADCLAERSRIARENQAAQTATRDAEGKVKQIAKSSLQQLPMCTPPVAPREIKLVKKQLPVRPAAERYLVVMTLSESMNASELDKRLRALTITATTVAQTIEGIAAGIYAGHGGTYGGVWVDW